VAVLRIGSVDVERVEELRIPNSIAYFTTDEALIAANRHWLAPHFLDAGDKFDLCFQSWVMVVEGRVVLVDPCTGNGRPHPVPFFDNLDVPFIERLGEAGFRPEDIDLVFCTHLHHDHCGWNTQLRDGKWVPTFPNARYLLARREVDRWNAALPGYVEMDYNVGVYERSVLPVLEAGLADLHDGHFRVGSALEVESAPGHTTGHCWLHVTSEGERAIFSGDSFHHPIQLVDPTIQFGGGDDLAQATATRRRLVETAAASGALIVPAHLPPPHGLRVRLEDGLPQFSACATPA
jgi:glyoxylase-like metal-dependent hydrolase (beta-lactamase superfamily II)